MILVVNIILLVTLVAILYGNASNSKVKIHFLIAMLVKLSSGVLMGVIYFYHYGSGDTLVYHEVANYLTQTGGSSFLELVSTIGKPDDVVVELFPILKEPRSAFFIKILSGFYLLTSGSYWLTSIYFSLLSFIGSWFLVNTFIRFDPAAKIPAIISFLYFPTFVFWSSGILKETIAWSCLSVIMAFFIIYIKTRKLSLWQLLLGVALIYVLWSIKYYFAAVLALCFFPLLLYQTFLSDFKRPGNSYLLILGVFFILIILMVIHPNFQPGRIMTVIQENHEMMKEMSGPGKSIQFIEFERPLLKFIVNLPLSLFGGLFMPLPWQGVNLFSLATGILNFILLLFFILKLIPILRKGITRITSWDLSMAFYIVILAILIAYTTPNFGTLERYKISYIGFFTFWIFYDNPYMTRIFRFRQQ